MGQQAALTWPAHAATGWDSALIANVDTLRAAHNATDTVATGAATTAGTAATAASSAATAAGNAATAAATADAKATSAAANAIQKTERVKVIRRYVVGSGWENADDVLPNAEIEWQGPVSIGLPPDGIQGGHQYARAGIDGYVGEDG